MKFSYRTYRIECRYPFGISRSSCSYYDIAYVYFEQDGELGRGEIAPPIFYKEKISDCISYLNKMPPEIPNFSNIDDFNEFLIRLNLNLRSIKAGLSTAFLDLMGKKKKLSIAEYFKVSPKINKPTSFTISIGDLDLLNDKIKDAKQYKILKIKLGSDKDKYLINKIRDKTDKSIRIDANEGWTFNEAIHMCSWLADKNVELIEQPLKSAQIEKMKELIKESPIPLIADENCITFDDIPKLVGSFNGINIKLMKCGGCDDVLKMIKYAQSLGLKVMLGCMVESSIAITSMSQFSSQADYIDLDGNLLIKNDPYDGMKLKDGIPVLNKKYGLGVTLNSIGKGAGLL